MRAFLSILALVAGLASAMAQGGPASPFERLKDDLVDAKLASQYCRGVTLDASAMRRAYRRPELIADPSFDEVRAAHAEARFRDRTDEACKEAIATLGKRGRKQNGLRLLNARPAFAGD